MRFALGPLLVIGAGACASRQASAPPASSPPMPPPSEAKVVNATVLANGCQELGRDRAKLAERAMNDLVEGCSSVPGGSARFLATLQPGGQIVIEAAAGEPDVVPICVLKHSLLHKVPLAKPCRLEVRMEQTNVRVPQR